MFTGSTAARKKIHVSAAETLISASLAAQAGLVGTIVTGVIPAMAESPIPVLARRNRTPLPQDRQGRNRTSVAKAA